MLTIPMFSSLALSTKRFQKFVRILPFYLGMLGCLWEHLRPNSRTVFSIVLKTKQKLHTTDADNQVSQPQRKANNAEPYQSLLSYWMDMWREIFEQINEQNQSNRKLALGAHSEPASWHHTRVLLFFFCYFCKTAFAVYRCKPEATSWDKVYRLVSLVNWTIKGNQREELTWDENFTY